MLKWIGLWAMLWPVIAWAQEHKTLHQDKDRLDSAITAAHQVMTALEEQRNVLQCEIIRAEMSAMGFPKSAARQSPVILHKAMALQYAEPHEQALWVMHMVVPEIAEGRAGRSNDFRVDTMVETGTAVQEDYFLTYQENGKTVYDGYGYDRGHLAPSADFRWYAPALSESYFYSNMSPMLPEFNREGWAELEGKVREYVLRQNTSVYVVTGPVLHADLPKMARSQNGVSIPAYFYKAIVDLKNRQAVAFLLPHKALTQPLANYTVPIDSVENMTGLDFFHKLDDSLEQNLETMAPYYAMFPQADGDVQPIPWQQLASGQINTHMALAHIGKKMTVCGTVVSTFVSKNGHTFINLDQKFPNQVFSVSIWKDDRVHFSYPPEKHLLDKKVCFTGKIGQSEGVPNMSIVHEKRVQLLD